ncbi:FAD-dependent monooxygenase [Hydrogenovibrio sp. 3SP14C1]|uniref:FAD-dependent monooxygenase n=1 Tax=Hydrogenovibrio sp. 3SP14C1 TaxID=3038774 RepID=UPI002416342F|nr:FAD-dependent monooxygenase [Hydrogenovibrio sp. 3SP14C1]MDG4813340.1 FAD-dependent monooxygenase [Hydrogenovibrio sp. 3SP14C1]
MTIEKRDVFISGGGPVGLILAIGLARAGRTVVLAEKNAFDQGEKGSFDGRVLALTYGSVCTLDTLGIWSDLKPCTTPIEHVHVSQKGYLGLTHLHASEMNVPALGYSVTASDLGHVLWQNAAGLEGVTLFSQSGLVDFQLQEDKQRVQLETLSGQQTFEVDLVIGADGTQSTVRQLLDLPIEIKDYQAFGVIAKIETEQHPNGWAFERFTEQGPVALLPMQEHESKAVWVVPAEEVEHVKALDDKDFIQAFSQRMGERLGAFISVSERVFYPLTETYVPTFIKPRAVLMGNASHTQHPVAAQGLNLGISDIQAFLDEATNVTDLGEWSLLSDYADERKTQHEKIMGLTDGLIQVFQTEAPAVGHLRGLGLMAMDVIPSLRKRFTKMTMGMK